MPPTRTTKQPSTIIVNGIELQPTKLFDTFWRWCAERKAMDDRRRAGLPHPWTSDRHLTQGYFCMPYRVLDRGCQFLITQIIQKGSQDPREVLFRILLYDIFTKISTYELIQSSLGDDEDQQPTWKSYNRRAYESIFRSAFQRGISLYTGAFIKPTGQCGKSSKENFCHHLESLEAFMKDDVLLNCIQTAEYMEDIFDFLKSFRGMGDFTAYQLLVNLSYSSLLSRFSNMDFVVAGIGCVSGLHKLFAKGSLNRAKYLDPMIYVGIIRWMADTQDEHFKRLGLDSTFMQLGSDSPRSAGIPLQLADIEHSICEVDKYARLLHPEMRAKRMNLRRTYKYVEGRTLPPVAIPKAWGDPRRKLVRIRPDGMGNANRAEAEEENAEDDSDFETSSLVSSFPSPASLDTVVASSASRSQSSSRDTLTEVSDVEGDGDVEMKNPDERTSVTEVLSIPVLRSSRIALKKLSAVSEIEEVLEHQPSSANPGSSSVIKYLVRHKSSRNPTWIPEATLLSTTSGEEAFRAYTEEQYVIERIGDMRIRKNGRQREFLVFWEGYGDEDATWEPESRLMEDAPLAVKEFLSNGRTVGLRG
ncbi:hypothetical protein E1B28_013539 [Marasmius oreades]|uniref:Chromo domain-containing protein n=1 Tax=Marasmius oreades TaxID=181124 RepID=A0A9P7RQ28_9AGAR|nr:uncharacterized protein E1B28_013539 [Marasmius oreades]KAG7087585.1 hypothetical protein E1B28_013539 [Marasmius oreades]